MPEEVLQGQEAIQPTEEEQPTTDLSPETKPAEDELPADASDRTKAQFEKLKEHNRQLLEQVQASQQRAPQRSVLEAYLPTVDDQDLQPTQGFQPSVTQPIVTTDQTKNSLFDESGFVDGAKLERELQKAELAERNAKEANARTARLEQQLQRMNIDQQTQKLHEKFPELDPTSKSFSEDAYNLVKKELLSQLVTTGKQDALGAAQQMAKYFRKDQKQAEKQEKLQQATTSVGSGNSSQGRKMSNDEFQKLKEKSRYDRDALAERLRRSGY